MYDWKPRNYVPRSGIVSFANFTSSKQLMEKRYSTDPTPKALRLVWGKLTREIGRAFNHVENLIHKHFCTNSVSQSAADNDDEEIVFMYRLQSQWRTASLCVSFTSASISRRRRRWGRQQAVHYNNAWTALDVGSSVVTTCLGKSSAREVFVYLGYGT